VDTISDVQLQLYFDTISASQMSGHLSIGDRWRIISLRFGQGINSREIARILHCSIRTVYNILQLFDDTDDVVE
jgi:hypothetical protein